MLVAALATAADPAPAVPAEGCPAVQQALAGVAAAGVSCDTDLTPVPKETELWKQVGGAVFPQGSSADPRTLVDDASPSSFDENLYAVAFRNAKLGLFGGAACADSRPGQESGCRPVILRYRKSRGRGVVWDRVDLGPASGEPGYVAAIAWAPNGHALAVGGSGRYPRRERPWTAPLGQEDRAAWDAWYQDDVEHGAGHGRAWYFDGTSWSELAVPAQMRALTTATFDRRPGTEFGFAGGMAQIWQFQNDGSTDNAPRFTTKFDRDTDATAAPGDRAVQGGALFRYRVRQLRFLPGSPRMVMGVTGGCCGPVGQNYPRIVAYWGDPNTGAGGDKGRVGPFVDAGPYPAGPKWFVSSYQSDLRDGSWNDDTEAARQHNVRQDLPDSFYALGAMRTFRSAGVYGAAAVITPVATPGGPPALELAAGVAPAPERASVITARSCVYAYGARNTTHGGGLALGLLSQWGYDKPLLDPVAEPFHGSWSSARLVAADGDVGGTPLNNSSGPNGWGPDPAKSGRPSTLSHCQVTEASAPADGVPDWVVGELRSTARPDGLGARGLAVGTAMAPGLAPDTVDASAVDAQDVGSLQKVTSAERVAAFPAAPFFVLGSYSVNAIDMLDEEGGGWMAGDHGAILTTGDTAAAAKDLPAPALGAPEPSTRDDAQAFDALRPLGTLRPGAEVPPLASQPAERLAEPRMVATGSPDIQGRGDHGPIEDVAQIAMSQDGSEGWAIGPDPLDPPGSSIATLYHFDGEAWRRCDPDGVPGEIAADPACADLAPFLRYRDANDVDQTVKLTAIGRIPTENGDDPSRQSEFEAVVVGTNCPCGPDGAVGPFMARYRHGRWALEKRETRTVLTGPAPAMRVEQPFSVGEWTFPALVFASPNDGWLVGVNRKFSAVDVFHFDGEHWISCFADRAACGDSARRLPLGERVGEIAGLASAGSRVYAYGSRREASSLDLVGTDLDAARLGRAPPSWPLVVFLDHGDPHGQWSDGSQAGGDGSGWDPGFGVPAERQTTDSSIVQALAVRQTPQGVEGWAFGRFGENTNTDYSDFTFVANTHNPATLPRAVAARLTPGGRWAEADDQPLLRELFYSACRSPLFGCWGLDEPVAWPALTSATRVGPYSAFVGQRGSGRLAGFDERVGHWRPVDSGRPYDPGGLEQLGGPQGTLQAVTSDGRGGLWVAVRNHNNRESFGSRNIGVHFLRLTDHPQRPVFGEVASPTAAPGLQQSGTGTHITALAGGQDGTVWLGTNSNRLFRYDRLTGWDELRVKGWDRGRVVTRPSEVFAVAVGPDGSGVAVGKRGRIADLRRDAVVLDAAAGVLCAGHGPPCGTSVDLRAAAVAPDGSALVGGERGTVLWRPSGQGFRRVSPPETGTGDAITGISMPSGDRAWLAMRSGQVHAGSLVGGDWRWDLESRHPDGELIGRDETGERIPALRAIAIDPQGHGFAVGDAGFVMERRPGQAFPWKRLDVGLADHLTAVALPAGGGPGALVGGHNGLLLTYVSGAFRVARPADYAMQGVPANDNVYGELTGYVAGVALLPGTRAGQVEAWAALAGRTAGHWSALNGGEHGGLTDDAANNGIDALLHYASDADDGLLNAGARALPLPDSPLPRPGELRFAAFGETTCQPNAEARSVCPALEGTTGDAEVISNAVVDGIVADARGQGGAAFSLFTGDMADQATAPGSDVVEKYWGPGSVTWWGPTALRHWQMMVADRMTRGGVPVYGAIGGRDLSSATNVCVVFHGMPPQSGCEHQSNDAKAGDNLSWRAAMSAMPTPWGAGPVPSSPNGDVSFAPTPGQAQPARDAGVQAATTDGAPTRARVPTGGARTHYAVDVLRDGRALARLIVLDTSQRSLTGGDAVQQPAEAAGQLAWLRGMLCFAGSADSVGARCTRGTDQQAIVVSSTPTYSYGPAALDETQIADNTQLEAVLMQYRANVVVSGRLGWNGVYWATAPGVHVPCPGGDYREQAPQTDSRPCGAESSQADQQLARAQRLASTLQGLGAPPPPAAGSAALPFVVSSSAGGRLADPVSDSAEKGNWRGYSIVRLDASGDPGKTIVEQRPVFDRLLLQGPTHTLRPGQRTRLRGLGREPVGIDTGAPTGDPPHQQIERWDRIDSPAITHRYDLVEADTQEPWLPKVVEGNGNPNGYVPVDPSVGTIDSQTGQVLAQRGNHGRIFALAVLSVGRKAATFPIAFEPKRSYTAPPSPRLTVAPIDPIRVLSFSASSFNTPTSTPPAPPPPPVNTTLSLPIPPALPNLTNATPLSLPPPAPPAPPAPPGGQTGTGLSVPIDISGVVVPPTPGFTAQPTPPVNPAPPGGARKEARQKQAATAKSEEGGAGEKASDGAGDLAGGPMGSNATPMTRRDRVKPAAAGFTPLTRAHASQPSAWTTGLQWGGGIGLMALVLALGFTTARPTPRRRPPVVPAPVWLRHRR